MLCNHSNSHVNPYSSTCDRSVCYDLFLERGRNRPTTEEVAARTGADKLLFASSGHDSPGSLEVLVE